MPTAHPYALPHRPLDPQVHCLDVDGTHILRKMGPMTPATSYLTLIEWLAQHEFTPPDLAPPNTMDNNTNFDESDSVPKCRSPVTLIAASDATLLRLPLADLTAFVSSRTDILVDVVRFIMFRLQRTSYMTLFQHLGLVPELLKDLPYRDRPKDRPAASPHKRPRSESAAASPRSSSLSCTWPSRKAQSLHQLAGTSCALRPCPWICATVVSVGGSWRLTDCR